MTNERRADLVLPSILDDLAGATELAYVDDVLRATARTRQPRLAASIQRWLPMLDTTHASASGPRVSWRAVAIAMALVVLVAAGLALLAGSIKQHQVAPPFGLATTGLVAFEQNGDIVATQPDGSGLRTLVSGPGVQWGPRWSHRGDRFAYWSTTSTNADLQAAPASLWVSDGDGTNQHVVSGKEPVYDVADLLSDVSWSPDDRQLAFSNEGVLEVVNVDGTGLHPLGDGSRMRDGPVWSPDGSLIAYTAQPLGDPANNKSLWVIAPDGTGDVQVVPSEGAFEIGAASDPSWSPDSRSVLVHTGGGDVPNSISIAQRNAAGNWSHRHLESGLQPDFLPAWSTAGTRFTFLEADQGSGALVVMVADADGTHVHALSTRPVTLTTPCWSPDDRFIRAEAAGQGRTILLIPLDGSPPVEIPAFDGVTAGCDPQRLAP